MLSPLRHQDTLADSSGDASGSAPWQLRGVGKAFGAVPALHDVNLHIGEGEIVSVTGPSGAGKSTLGRLISGLETIGGGEIVCDGRRMDALPARARRVAHMFESFALYPTRTVAQNIASPLEAPAHAGRFDAAQRAARIAEVLALTEMSALAARLPSQLSGGQKQRVALCRALVQEPSLYVLDEPIGHLDARLRHHLRGEIRRRQGRQRQGTLWLTPDGIEAMAVADRLVVLIGGHVQQTGTPDAVFARPANVAVARLIGDPAMNVLQATLRHGDSPALQIGVAPPVPVSRAFVHRFGACAAAGRLQLGLRPADLRLLPASGTSETAEPGDTLPGNVYAVEPLGKQTLVTVDVAGQRLRVKTGPLSPWALGDAVRLAFAFDRALSFDADTGVLQA